MAKTIKSLLRISMAIRNLGTFNGCAAAKRFIQTSSTSSTRSNKDALVSPQPHLVIHSTAQVPMFKYCEDHADILNIVRTNKNTMSGPDAATALHELFRADRKNGGNTSKMYEQEDFLLLCEILKKNIRQLSVSDAIQAIKAFTHFDVPSTSVIVQTALQMIRHSVNDLTIQQIEFLDFLFGRCERTPIIEALYTAMPIVYERNVLVQLDRQNMKSIVSALAYLCKYSENADILDVIIHAIRNCPNPLDETLAKSVLFALFDIRCHPRGLPALLKGVQSILAENIANQDRRTLKSMMMNLALRVRDRGQHYYHEGLVDACASTVISEDWGFSDGLEILSRLIRMGHSQIFLLDYIAAKCFEDPKTLESCDPSEIVTLITGFSQADYKPVFWDVIEECVMTTLEKDPQVGGLPLTTLALNLLSLDCYRPKIVEAAFSRYTDNVPARWRIKSKLLLLYQAVNTLYPQYTGPWPNQQVLDVPPPRLMKGTEDFPLITTLESALGGRRYVLSNVRSSLGHIIDHVLVMRKGGFPVAINNEADRESDELPVRQLDELQPPQDGQVILVVLIPADGYSVNSQRMKGIWSLRIRTLEALTRYTVIPIQSSMWTSLPLSERMPYLMQAIRLKFDEMSISANP